MTPTFWDDRYRATHAAYGETPNRFLAASAGLLPREGRALVPADGQGRNGLWLAAHGLVPLCVDYSAVALDQARRTAAQRGLACEMRVDDFLTTPLEPGAFAVIASIFFHVLPSERATIHARMVDALAPSGILVLEGFARGHTALKERHDSGGPGREDMLFGEEDLMADFAGLEPLFLEVCETVLDEGPFHQGPAKVLRTLMRKP